MGKPYTPVEGLREVERLWLNECQQVLVEESKFHIWQQQFGLFKDLFCLIRCQGRLENADAPYDVRHPTILTTQNPLCELIMRDCHHKVKHNGVRETLTPFRSKIWMVKGRSIVRKIIYKCAICHKLEGLLHKLPPPPPLPRFRVNRVNGKTFKAAAGLVHKILSGPEVQAYFTQQRVNWTFNLERAPWWGGFFLKEW